MIMQQPKTSTVDAEKEVKKPKIVDLLKVSVDEEMKIYVNWPTDKKELCLVALAEAVKLVATYLPPKIVRPKPSILDFIRSKKR